MKLARLLILPVLTIAATGCTVHNHYYASGSAPSVAAAHQPGQHQLAAKLKGIHTAMKVTADKIANAETLGYKARRVSFHEGNPMPIVTTDWTGGAPVLTGRTLDLFIDGDGFFQIEVEQEKGGGLAYTRLGQFYFNRDGELVLGQADGPRLAGGLSAPIDAINISVSATGVVTATLPDNSMEEIGQIELHGFISPQGLERDNSGLYFETEASGPAATGVPCEGAMGRLMQQYIEAPNVNLIAEIMELENLARWGQAIARELGPSAIQQHGFYTLRSQADIDVQVGLVKQLGNAMDAVYGEQTAELPVLPSLHADD